MGISTRIKQFLYPLYIYPKTRPAVKKKLNNLYEYYRQKVNHGEIADHKKHEVKIFSNLEEDGIILWIFSTLGISKGYFIDIGSNDCINSNCANLAFNFNWSGLFIDSSQKLLSIGRKNYKRYSNISQYKFVCSFVTPENINDLISANTSNKEVDFISIDIDGNDYEIFKAISFVKPKCFVVENKIEYGSYDLIVPPNGNNDEPGASPVAVTKLAEKKGYTLIAANKPGFNTFYLRNDLVSVLLPKLSLVSILNDPEVSKDFYPPSKMHPLMQQYNSGSLEPISNR